MVTLTYEVIGRPEAVRPIPGETVVFTCEVEDETLTWANTAFLSSSISFIRVNNPPGDRATDSNTGALFNLLITKGVVGRGQEKAVTYSYYSDVVHE